MTKWLLYWACCGDRRLLPESGRGFYYWEGGCFAGVPWQKFRGTDHAGTGTGSTQSWR